jgi:hypothetical protein
VLERLGAQHRPLTCGLQQRAAALERVHHPALGQQLAMLLQQQRQHGPPAVRRSQRIVQQLGQGACQALPLGARQHLVSFALLLCCCRSHLLLLRRAQRCKAA